MHQRLLLPQSCDQLQRAVFPIGEPNGPSLPIRKNWRAARLQQPFRQRPAAWFDRYSQCQYLQQPVLQVSDGRWNWALALVRGARKRKGRGEENHTEE